MAYVNGGPVPDRQVSPSHAGHVEDPSDLDRQLVLAPIVNKQGLCAMPGFDGAAADLSHAQSRQQLCRASNSPPRGRYRPLARGGGGSLCVVGAARGVVGFATADIFNTDQGGQFTGANFAWPRRPMAAWSGGTRGFGKPPDAALRIARRPPAAAIAAA
jgi:hypothetical protein